MKNHLRILLSLLICVAVGCSSNTSTPQEQLETITTMLSKGYEVSVQEQQNFDDQIAQAKEFIKAGKKEDAQKILSSVLVDLEAVAERDRYNKTE